MIRGGVCTIVALVACAVAKAEEGPVLLEQLVWRVLELRERLLDVRPFPKPETSFPLPAEAYPRIAAAMAEARRRVDALPLHPPPPDTTPEDLAFNAALRVAFELERASATAAWARDRAPRDPRSEALAGRLAELSARLTELSEGLPEGPRGTVERFRDMQREGHARERAAVEVAPDGWLAWAIFADLDHTGAVGPAIDPVAHAEALEAVLGDVQAAITVLHPLQGADTDAQEREVDGEEDRLRWVSSWLEEHGSAPTPLREAYLAEGRRLVARLEGLSATLLAAYEERSQREVAEARAAGDPEAHVRECDVEQHWLRRRHALLLGRLSWRRDFVRLGLDPPTDVETLEAELREIDAAMNAAEERRLGR